MSQENLLDQPISTELQPPLPLPTKTTSMPTEPQPPLPTVLTLPSIPSKTLQQLTTPQRVRTYSFTFYKKIDEEEQQQQTTPSPSIEGPGAGGVGGGGGQRKEKGKSRGSGISTPAAQQTTPSPSIEGQAGEIGAPIGGGGGGVDGQRKEQGKSIGSSFISGGGGKKKEKKKASEGDGKPGYIGYYDYSETDSAIETTYDSDGDRDDNDTDLLLEEKYGRGKEEELYGDLPLRYRKKQLPAFSNRIYRPYFTIGISIFEIIFMFVEIIVNKGIESIKVNPWLGVSLQTLVDTGAKYVPYIIIEHQWWRYLTPTFGHAGLIHLAINMLAQLLVGIQLERTIGPWRVAIIYFLSGIGGTLLSTIFLPNQIEVGASAAIYGLGSYLLADMIIYWVIIANVKKYCIGLTVGTLIGLLIGIFPGIDNFAHIGGTIVGLLVSLCLIPKARIGKAVSKRTRMAMMLAPPLLALYFAICFIVIYVPSLREKAGACSWCEEIDCPRAIHWCKN